MFKNTAERKIEVLKAIQQGIYSNEYVANKLNIRPIEINYDKQTLYKNDFIDRGFGNQIWVLTDKGESALKGYFKTYIPSKEIKLEVLKHLQNTNKPLIHLGNNYESTKGKNLHTNKYNYHKKWLVKNGYIDGKTKRGVVTKKGIDAIKNGFQEGI